MYTVHLALSADAVAALSVEANGGPLGSLIQKILGHRMPAPPVAAFDWSYAIGASSTDGAPIAGFGPSGPLGLISTDGTPLGFAFRSASFGATAVGLARIQAEALTAYPTTARRVAMMLVVYDAIASHLADPAATWALPYHPWNLE